MDDPSFIRIHRLKYNRPSVSLYFMRDVLCQMFQCLFPSRAVVLCIELNPYIACLVFVCHTVCQVLEGIQRLASLSDHCLLYTSDAADD